jgi:hypothetical protein
VVKAEHCRGDYYVCVYRLVAASDSSGVRVERTLVEYADGVWELEDGTARPATAGPLFPNDGAAVPYESAVTAAVKKAACFRCKEAHYTLVVVELYEDHGGHLYLVSGDVAWADLERVDSTFRGDALAIADGDTDDWTVPRIAPEQVLGGRIAQAFVANGSCEIRGAPGAVIGAAAQRYLGADYEAVVAW